MHLADREEPTSAQLEAFLTAGGRLVFYEYCISFVVFTLRRPSALYRLPAGDRGVVRGLPYTLVSLLFGWWGLPWGLIYTPLVLLTNLSGGRDVTAEVYSRLRPAVSPVSSENPAQGEEPACERA